MGRKYMVKLKGTNCYLRNTGAKSINFTTDIKKAKVFEDAYNVKSGYIIRKPDFIDKLNVREYKVRKESVKTDFIRLTMDRSTWQEMYNEHLDQIQEISVSRKKIHQYKLDLTEMFEIKSKTYKISEEYPNFECDYYGEDFEREYL